MLKGGKITKRTMLKGGVDFKLLIESQPHINDDYYGFDYNPNDKNGLKNPKEEFEEEFEGFGFQVALDKAYKIANDNRALLQYIDTLNLDLLSIFFNNVMCEYTNHPIGDVSETIKYINNSIKYMEALPNLDAVKKWYNDKIKPLETKLRSQLPHEYNTMLDKRDMETASDFWINDDEKNKIIKYETLNYLKALVKDNNENNVFKKEIIKIEKAEDESTKYVKVVCKSHP